MKTILLSFFFFNTFSFSQDNKEIGLSLNWPGRNRRYFFVSDDDIKKNLFHYSYNKESDGGGFHTEASFYDVGAWFSWTNSENTRICKTGINRFFYNSKFYDYSLSNRDSVLYRADLKHKAHQFFFETGKKHTHKNISFLYGIHSSLYLPGARRGEYFKIVSDTSGILTWFSNKGGYWLGVGPFVEADFKFLKIFKMGLKFNFNFIYLDQREQRMWTNNEVEILPGASYYGKTYNYESGWMEFGDTRIRIDYFLPSFSISYNFGF